MPREQMGRSDLPPMWQPCERYVGRCVRCGNEGLKRNMISIYVKKGAYENMKMLCHICRDCYTAFLDDAGIGEE